MKQSPLPGQRQTDGRQAGILEEIYGYFTLIILNQNQTRNHSFQRLQVCYTEFNKMFGAIVSIITKIANAHLACGALYFVAHCTVHYFIPQRCAEREQKARDSRLLGNLNAAIMSQQRNFNDIPTTSFKREFSAI